MNTRHEVIQQHGLVANSDRGMCGCDSHPEKKKRRNQLTARVSRSGRILL